MKNIKIYLLSMIGILLYSCNDAINITQPSQVSPDATYKDMKSLLYNLQGLYSDIPYENTIAFSSIFTDECAIGVANGGQGLSDGSYGYLLNSGSGEAASIWSSYYSTINNANRFIEGSQSVVYDEAADGSAFRDALAQAHAIRAFSYFQLLSYFSTDLTNNNALGVMLFDNVPVYGSATLPRSTVGQVFDFIDADLLYVDANLSESAINKVNANFVAAFRARMALYRGDYVKAQDQAQTLISSIPLSSRSVYPTMFNPSSLGGLESNGECIFKLTRALSSIYIGKNWASVSTKVSGSPFFEMGRSLFNKFAPGAADIRKAVNVNSTSIISPDYQNTYDYKSQDILCINKYGGSQGVRLFNDVKVFRVSEMYLIKAEAQARQGNLTGAATTIKALRTARISGTQPLPVYADAKAAFKDILLERRKELAYEGHRYLDIKRLGVVADETFDRDPLDCAINNSCFFSNTDYRLTMPIPKSELISNPNIVSQQNPNY
jgi:hypothetical protein